MENNENIKEVREGNVPIPKGYNYVKGDKIGGVIITDASSGKENEGNEFVWIPVEKVSNMAEQVDGVDANNNTNYRGILYNWKSDKTGKTIYKWTQTSKNYFEPINLSDSLSGDEVNSSKINDWSNTLYQEEYNKMVKSVEKYGGFYVGRYEMSVNENSGNAESKYGATSANAKDSNTSEWFGLYNKSKTYAKETDNKNVVSNMIWGSQYDAMLRWMVDSGVKNITSTNPVDLSEGETSKNKTRVTGSEAKDIINNIYDLLGNSYEWTQEALNIQAGRTARGGIYKDNYNYAPSYREGRHSTGKDPVDGTRLALYIK